MARRGAGKAKDSSKHGRRQLSDEQRQQLSERARKLHSEGKFGGREHGLKGGRPRKTDRIGAQVSEAAKQNSKAIISALKAGVSEGSAAQRTRAAETWTRLAALEEAQVQKEMESEQKITAQLSREAMLEALSQKLMSGPVAGLLRERLAEPEVVDGSAELIDADVVPTS